MIGIIGAMKIEVDCITSLMKDKTIETISSIEYHKGKINGKDCVCAIGGVGKVNAAICTQTMILKYQPNIIINTGVAGGIINEMHVGDIAIATSVMQHDMDTSAVGDPKGMISGINIIDIPCSIELVQKLKDFCCSKDIAFFAGTIATGDQFINEGRRLKKIAQSFNAIACEMEGASIGQVCYINNVPFAVVRSISDTADNNASIDYANFSKKAAEISADIVISLVKTL